MHPRFIISCGVAVLTLGLTSAHAAPVTVDFKTLGSLTTAQLDTACVTVTADDGLNPATVNVLNANGLGVVGGFSSNTVDGSEALLFSFHGAPAIGVRYTVTSAGNQNGNGTVGDSFVEAFDAIGASLGIKSVSGSGQKDLAALFGGWAISAFRVRADVDNLRIGSLSYNNPVPSTTAEFTSLGTFTTTNLMTQGLQVTADDGVNPATVNVLNFNGIGVVGGLFNNSIDSNEALCFDFVGLTPENVTFWVISAGNQNGNGKIGEAFVEAFDHSGATLGTVAIDGGGTFDLTVLFGDHRFSRFEVRANVDNSRIGNVIYDFPRDSVDFTAMASTTTSRLATGELIAHAMTGGAAADLEIVSGVGLGVIGGLSNAAIDGNEEATFFFDGNAATGVEVFITAAGNQNGNGTVGDAFVEAFGDAGQSLGVLAVNGADSHEVSALFGDRPISGFTIRADTDDLTIGELRFRPQHGSFAFPFYGTGCPGTGGVIPSLRVTSCSPTSGSDVTVAMSDGPGGSSALLLLGFGRLSVPMGFGCDLYVMPPLVPIGPLPLSGGGTLTLTAPLPAVVAPVTITLQALTIDGGASGGFANTNGVELNLKP